MAVPGLGGSCGGFRRRGVPKMWAINKILGAASDSWEKDGIVLSNFMAKKIVKTDWCITKDIADGKGGFTKNIDICAYGCDSVKLTFRLCADKKESCKLQIWTKIDVSCCDNAGYGLAAPAAAADGPKTEEANPGGSEERAEASEGGKLQTGKKRPPLIFEVLETDADGDICDAEVLKSGVVNLKKGRTHFNLDCNFSIDEDLCKRLDCGAKLYLRVVYGKCSICKCFTPDKEVKVCDTINKSNAGRGSSLCWF